MTEKNGKNGRAVALGSGKEIVISLKGMTWKEVAEAAATTRWDKKNAAFLAQAAGITVEEFEALEYSDAQTLERAVWRLVHNPLEADPN